MAVQQLLNGWVYTGGVDPAGSVDDRSGNMAARAQAKHNGHWVTYRS